MDLFPRPQFAPSFLWSILVLHEFSHKPHIKHGSDCERKMLCKWQSFPQQWTCRQEGYQVNFGLPEHNVADYIRKVECSLENSIVA